MKEIGPIAGIDCKNTMTEMKHIEGIDHQSITKIIMKEGIIAHFRTMEMGEIINIIIRTNMKESIIIHFRTMEIGEIIKIVIKTSIGMKISMIQIILKVEMGHMTETGHIVETGTAPENTGERSYSRDRLYDRNDSYSRDRSYSRERSQEYCRDVYKEENHKYKRRSRDYYEDTSENRHHMDKYECQFRNDRYDIIRGRSKEKHCSLGFYTELEELYSSMGAVDVQDLQDLHTKIIDELELSDIHLIEQYILDKEEKKLRRWRNVL